MTNHRLKTDFLNIPTREVFNTLAAEDAEFIDESDEDEELPSFGKSDDDYESVVGPFYSFWSVYSTTRSYSWLDKYDTRLDRNKFETFMINLFCYQIFNSFKFY